MRKLHSLSVAALSLVLGPPPGIRHAPARAVEVRRVCVDPAKAARDKLDHSAGRPFRERISSSGFDAKMAVENISAGYHTMAEAFSGWRDSPPHRANMLAKGATRMGIAAVYSPNSKYKVFWALILAAPDEPRGKHGETGEVDLMRIPR